MTESVSPAPAVAALPSLLPKVFRVAWMSIGLGIALEVLLLILAAFTGTAGDSPRPVIADLAQKVSWSMLVCIGLALGTVAQRLRSVLMGGLGFLAAPAAFATAKAVHKGIGQALGVVSPGAALAIPLLIALLKAIEYGVLGAVLGKLGKTERALSTYLAAGAAVGIVFGSAIVVAMTKNLAAASAIDLAAKGINELLFPVGCSLVIYASDTMGRKLARP